MPVLTAAVALTCLLLVSPVGAARRFVSTSGNDGWPGTFEEPWATLQHAASSASAGDTVFVRGGNYPGHVQILRSGSPTEGYITFMNYEDEHVSLDPGSIVGWNASYIRVDGLHILNPVGETPGIEFHGHGGYVEILNCEVTGLDAANTAAIRVGGTMHDFLIEGNHVHHNNTGNQEAIRVHNSTRDFVVTRNEVNDNVNIGIDIVGWEIYGKPKRGVVSHNYVHNNTLWTQYASGIYLDAPDSIVVEYNVSAYNNFGYQLGCEPSDGSSSGNIMRYNVSYGNDMFGLSIGGYTGGSVHHSQVHNNVFYDNGTAINFSTNAGHDNAIFNNILVEPAGVSIAYLGTPVNTVIDYNCYYTGHGPTPGANSIFANPLFESVGEFNFRLREGSPCIDRGDPATPAGFDMDGMPVPLDGDGDLVARADMGAYEFLPATGVEDPVCSAAEQRLLAPNTPNPFNPATRIRYHVRSTDAPVTVAVLTPAGRLVRTLISGDGAPGWREVIWDGTDAEGRRVASGVYLCVARSATERDAIKLVLLK